MDFLCGSAGKESACNAGDLGSVPGLGKCPGEGKGYPLQCSGLENSIDCIVHGVAKSQTRLSDFHFHSSILGKSCLKVKRAFENYVVHFIKSLNFAVHCWMASSCLSRFTHHPSPLYSWHWEADLYRRFQRFLCLLLSYWICPWGSTSKRLKQG